MQEPIQTVQKRRTKNHKVCTACGEEKPLEAFPYDSDGDRKWYRKTCKRCKKKRESEVKPKIPVEVRREMVELEKELRALRVTKIAFETLEHPEDLKKVNLLIRTTHTVLATFLKYQDIVHGLFSNMYEGERYDNGDDSFHVVAGEEMNLPENQEGVY